MTREHNLEPEPDLAESLDIVHGGTVRLPTRWVGPHGAPTGLVGCKRYEVPPGAVCARHVHSGKTEYWLIVQGHADVTVGEVSVEMTVGDAVRTPPGVPHRIVNRGTDSVIFINVFELHPDTSLSTTELEEA